MVLVTLLELDELDELDELFEGDEPEELELPLDPDELDPELLLDPESDEPEPDDVEDAPDGLLAASVDEEVERESVR